MRKGLLAIGLFTTLMCGMLCVKADDNQQSTPLVSRGGVNLTNGSDSINIDTVDLYTLRTALVDLETRYDSGVVTALGKIGTIIATEDPTFEELINGIVHSQDISTDTIVDNISEGKEAWVNGKKIVGTGGDVHEAYSQGYIDGVNYNTTQANINYTYHEHKNSSGTVIADVVIYSDTNPGGCYVANGHTHDAITPCAKTANYSHACDSGCYSYEKEHYIPHTEVWFDAECSCGGCWNEKTTYEYSHSTTEWVHSNNQVISGYTYNCGFPTNTFTTGCGKTTNTIESATIVFK